MSWGDCENCKGCTDDTCLGGCGVRWCAGSYMGHGCDRIAKNLRALLSQGHRDPFRKYRRLYAHKRVVYTGVRRMHRDIQGMPGNVLWRTTSDIHTDYWVVQFQDGKIREIYEGDLR